MNKSMWFITLKSHRINCSCLVTKKNKNADSSYSIIVTGHKKSLSDTGAGWVFTNGSCCNSEDNERPGRQNSMVSHWFKVKLSPKCNLGCFFCFFCECPRVKPSCKSIITMKEALLRLTIFSFSAQTRFQWECYGHFYASIKIAILKTLRRTTWNFAHSIARVKRKRKYSRSWKCLFHRNYAFTRRFDSYTFRKKKPMLHFKSCFQVCCLLTLFESFSLNKGWMCSAEKIRHG